MKKWHLWVAASIGLVVIAGMMIREFDVEALSKIDLSCSKLPHQTPESSFLR